MISVLARRTLWENRLHIPTEAGVFVISSSNSLSGSVTLLTSAALRNTSSASSIRPFLRSHLGDSGMTLETANLNHFITKKLAKKIYMNLKKTQIFRKTWNIECKLRCVFKEMNTKVWNYRLVQLLYIGIAINALHMDLHKFHTHHQ